MVELQYNSETDGAVYWNDYVNIFMKYDMVH